MNRKMLESQVEDLQLLERDLLRELTDTEAEYVINKGYKTFFEDCLNWDDEDYKYWRLMTRMLSTYYTKSEQDLQDLINATPDNDKHQVAVRLDNVSKLLNKYDSIDESYEDDCNECCECPLCKFERISNLIEETLPKLDEEALELLGEYDDIDPNHVELISIAMDFDDIEEGFMVSDLVDALSEKIINTVADHYYTKVLANRGKVIMVPEKLVNFITDKLFNTKENLRIKVINNTIMVL